MPELIVRMEMSACLEEAIFAAAARFLDEFDVAVDDDGSNWIILLSSSTALPNDLTQRVELGVVDEMLRVFAREKGPIFETLDRAGIGAPTRWH